MLTWQGSLTNLLRHSRICFAIGLTPQLGIAQPFSSLITWKLSSVQNSRCVGLLTARFYPLTFSSNQHAESFRTRQLTELFLSYYSSSTTATPRNARGIVVIGTSASQASLHPLLARLHVFSDMMNILPPNMDARKEVSWPTPYIYISVCVSR